MAVQPNSYASVMGVYWDNDIIAYECELNDTNDQERIYTWMEGDRVNIFYCQWIDVDAAIWVWL